MQGCVPRHPFLCYNGPTAIKNGFDSISGGIGQAMAGETHKHLRWGAITLAALLGLYALWSFMTGWAPSSGEYETQGILVSEANGTPNWPMLGATGVDFAYLTATVGAKHQDTSFESNLEGVTQAGVRYGAVHHFDICRLASDQATLFNTTVPRTPNALPPAVQLDFSSTCTGHPARALILSELVTFLGQIEAHSGHPAILLLDRNFEEEYQLSKSIDRKVWLEGNYFLPDYSARPWIMWTANKSRRINGVVGPVHWVVVRN
jgi:lysozyme